MKNTITIIALLLSVMCLAQTKEQSADTVTIVLKKYDKEVIAEMQKQVQEDQEKAKVVNEKYQTSSKEYERYMKGIIAHEDIEFEDIIDAQRNAKGDLTIIKKKKESPSTKAKSNPKGNN